jgi:hypothetical protein
VCSGQSERPSTDRLDRKISQPLLFMSRTARIDGVAFFFWRMPDDTGHEISGRKAVEISSHKGADKEAVKAAS